MDQNEPEKAGGEVFDGKKMLTPLQEFHRLQSAIVFDNGCRVADALACKDLTFSGNAELH